jgi:hypothetical protein
MKKQLTPMDWVVVFLLQAFILSALVLGIVWVVKTLVGLFI